MDTLLRPDVSAERHFELENLAMQLILQMPSDIGEALIVRDYAADILGRRVQMAKTAGRLKHLIPAGSVETLTRLRLVDADA